MFRSTKLVDDSVWLKSDFEYNAHISQKVGHTHKPKRYSCAENICFSPSVQIFNPLPGPCKAFDAWKNIDILQVNVHGLWLNHSLLKKFIGWKYLVHLQRGCELSLIRAAHMLEWITLPSLIFFDNGAYQKCIRKEHIYSRCVGYFYSEKRTIFNFCNIFKTRIKFSAQLGQNYRQQHPT